LEKKVLIIIKNVEITIKVQDDDSKKKSPLKTIAEVVAILVGIATLAVILKELFKG
jgi:hypothetical protein